MTETSKAVFVSYASEDGEAASRIASALRAAGLEVWFDQSELRGGDAWDRQIRKQIRECALFVPIISAQSEARIEDSQQRLPLMLVGFQAGRAQRNRRFLFDDTQKAAQSRVRRRRRCGRRDRCQ